TSWKRLHPEGESAMCELLGISCSARVKPARYFKTFRRRGEELPEGEGNPDGWGIALYPDGKAVQVIKKLSRRHQANSQNSSPPTSTCVQRFSLHTSERPPEELSVTTILTL